MVWKLLFWSGFVVSLGIGLMYFRDLGDVSQMVLKVKRKNMIRSIVMNWDSIYESVGAWYNDCPVAVTRVDFFGDSDRGQLERVETLKSGLFWHVWAEFFKNTDINRIDEVA
jgi:hypothetical protein